VVHKGAERLDRVMMLAHRRVRRVDALLEDTQAQVRDLTESAASTVRHLGSAAFLAKALLTRGKKRRARKRTEAERVVAARDAEEEAEENEENEENDENDENEENDEIEVTEVEVDEKET
jgi:TATA-binding protein-associated factor Taf7